MEATCGWNWRISRKDQPAPRNPKRPPKTSRWKSSADRAPALLKSCTTIVVCFLTRAFQKQFTLESPLRDESIGKPIGHPLLAIGRNGAATHVHPRTSGSVE